MTRLVCVSDTHGHQPEVPDGDVLIFAGDACSYGTFAELHAFASWTAYLPHPVKLFVPGNHDWPLAPASPPSLGRFPDDDEAHYLLRDAGWRLLMGDTVEHAGLRFYGLHGQPAFNGWAFDVPRGSEALRRHWERIEPCDVLITHCPPFGRLDMNASGERVGCERLAERLLSMEARGTGPRLHVFGHVHEGRGLWPPVETPERLSINASTDIGQAPFVVDYADGEFRPVVESRHGV